MLICSCYVSFLLVYLFSLGSYMLKTFGLGYGQNCVEASWICSERALGRFVVSLLRGNKTVIIGVASTFL